MVSPSALAAFRLIITGRHRQCGTVSSAAASMTRMMPTRDAMVTMNATARSAWSAGTARTPRS